MSNIQTKGGSRGALPNGMRYVSVGELRSRRDIKSTLLIKAEILRDDINRSFPEDVVSEKDPRYWTMVNQHRKQRMLLEMPVIIGYSIKYNPRAHVVEIRADKRN